MTIRHFLSFLTTVSFVFSQERKSFTGCEMLVQFSINNGTVIGNLDYHFNHNPETKQMIADIRGFTTILPANFDFGIKHLNGEEWHCLNSTTEYHFMSCTHPLTDFDTFIVSLKTSTFLPNILELNKITIENSGIISWKGYSFTENCINHDFKYSFYKEPVNVQQKFCCW